MGRVVLVLPSLLRCRQRREEVMMLGLGEVVESAKGSGSLTMVDQLIGVGRCLLPPRPLARLSVR